MRALFFLILSSLIFSINFLILRWSLKPNRFSKLDDKSKKLTPNFLIFSTLFSEIDPANAYFVPFGSLEIKFWKF